MSATTWRAGTLLERLLEGKGTPRHRELLLESLAAVTRDPNVDNALRVATAALLSAIEARLLELPAPPQGDDGG